MMFWSGFVVFVAGCLYYLAKQGIRIPRIVVGPTYLAGWIGGIVFWVGLGDPIREWDKTWFVAWFAIPIALAIGRRWLELERKEEERKDRCGTPTSF
jgi:hypothetical protein